MRAYSLPSPDHCDLGKELEQQTKRKRIEETQRIVQKSIDGAFEGVVENMLMEIERLNIILKNMYKPKQKIKEIACRLAAHLKCLNSVEILNRPTYVRAKALDGKLEKAQKEIVKLENQIHTMEIKHIKEIEKLSRNYTSTTQCEECRTQVEKQYADAT